jgi:hypothetical protein
MYMFIRMVVAEILESEHDGLAARPIRWWWTIRHQIYLTFNLIHKQKLNKHFIAMIIYTLRKSLIAMIAYMRIIVAEMFLGDQSE